MTFKISKSVTQLLLLVALISCKQEKQTAKNLAGKAKEIIQLDLDDVANNASKASVIVKNIEYIPLESPPGAMVGEVTDIQFTDGKYYIMDRLSNSIFVFSQNGEFKSKIAAIGKAEGEYINISAFTVIPKSNKICIYDARLKKIIFYDSTGKFEREIKTDVLITDLAFPSDSVAHIYTAFFPNIVNLDKTELNRLYTHHNPTHIGYGNSSKANLNYTYNKNLVRYVKTVNNFSIYKDSITFVESLNNTIYRVLPTGKMIKRFYFDAGEHAINAGLNMDANKVDALNKNKEKFKLRTIMETTDYLAFRYAFNGYVNLGIYSKNSHKSYLINAFWVDDLNKVSIPFPRLSADGYLIGIRDAFKFKQLLKNNTKAAAHVKELAAKLDDSSNPVIVEIKLKPF